MCLPGPIKCPSCDAGCWYVQEDLPWLHIHNSERINWKRKHHFYGDWIIFSWTHWLRALQGDRHQIWYCATAQKQESWQMQNHNHVQKPNGDGIFGHKTYGRVFNKTKRSCLEKAFSLRMCKTNLLPSRHEILTDHGGHLLSTSHIIQTAQTRMLWNFWVASDKFPVSLC